MNTSHHKLYQAILNALSHVESIFNFNVESQMIGNQEKLVVNARDLHTQLEVKTEYRAWINRRLSEYNFVENQDFVCRSNLIVSKSTSPKARNQVSKEYFVTLDVAKQLCMVERTEKGRQVRLYFIQLEEFILNELAKDQSAIAVIDHQTTKSLPQKLNTTIGDYIQMIDFIKDALNPSKSSLMSMSSKACIICNMDSSFLPEYVDQNPTQSLTVLLKEHNIKMTAHDVNLILEKFGIIEQKSRISTKTPDRTKQFWIITKKGLEFGINLVSPKNQRETTPHYYIQHFDKMLKIIGLLN